MLLKAGILYNSKKITKKQDNLLKQKHFSFLVHAQCGLMRSSASHSHSGIQVVEDSAIL